MKKLKESYIQLNNIIVSFIVIIILFCNQSYSNEIKFEIEGNDYTDTDAILSLLDDIPENLDKEYSNDIINTLNQSNLFSEVIVSFDKNTYKIIVKEFLPIKKIYFSNNKRLDDEELNFMANEINLNTYNEVSIKLFIDEIKKIYESFGYNNVKIEHSKKLNEDTNTVNAYFNILEGKITKINKIFIKGNEEINSTEIREIINSKTKTFRNIFANNNYKPPTIERDKFIILKYYKNNGYHDAEVSTNIEYLESNKVNIYFNIIEGDIYKISSIKINDEINLIDKNTLSLIENEIDNFLIDQNVFLLIEIQELKKNISEIIIDSGVEFFEINTYDKKDNRMVEVLFSIDQILPKYSKQINIFGNSRTFDYVIRRELNTVEGDAIYPNQINDMRDELISLNLFDSVNIKEELVDENLVNINIEVKEKQTGSFNAGVSVGTLDGFAIVTGLRERNFYGTGRSLDVLVNTSEDRNQFKLITTDRLSYENDADISYSINYRQQDYSKASSYKLDTFSSGIGLGYKINTNIYHNIDLEYVLKDYKITDSSSVSQTIASSSGANISYLIKNNLRYSSVNPGFISKKGRYINFNNTVETPTSSRNGFIRNIITFKNYYSSKNNIFSLQTQLGNITSLNNNDILTDDKFALGGRWLRGFDNYGAGPRNSRSSYVGGNNIAVTKLDYSYELTRQSDFPIYLNIFNDYGIIWENKTKPTNSDSNLRSSAGFGFKYYSPIGPIGFTWGFPLIHEEYDIKRMFLFSIGNID